MHDGITFERVGIPSAVVITEPFIPTAEAITELDGLPDYGYVAIPHPVTSLPVGQLAARARAAARQVEAVLLGTARDPHDPRDADDAYERPTTREVERVLRPYRQGLRSDGADLVVDSVAEGVVSVRLVFGDDTCLDCIMPSTTVREVLSSLLSKHFGQAVNVVLDDPRDSAGGIGPGPGAVG